MAQQNGAGLQSRHMFSVLDAAIRIATLALVTGQMLFLHIDNATFILCIPVLLLANTCLVLLAFLLLSAFSFFQIQPAGILSVGIALPALVLWWRGCLLSRSGPLRRRVDKYPRLIRSVLSALAVYSLVLLVFRPITSWLPLVWIVILLLFRHSLPKPPRSKASQWLPNLVLMLVSTSITLVVAEVIARHTAAGQPRQVLDVWGPHPEACYTLRPNSSAEFLRKKTRGIPEAMIPVRISSQGLRDREYGPREPDEFRIFLLGDSFTMGWALEVEYGYVKELGKRLQNAGLPCRVSVLNGGCGGYGPWQERIFLRERGFPRDPCLVLHQVFPGNDIENSLEHHGRFLRAHNKHTAEALLRWRYKQMFPVRAEEWFLDHVALYRILLRVTDETGLISDFLWNTRFISPFQYVEMPPSEDRPFQLEFCLREWYPELEEGWRLFEEDVRAIKSDCISRGVLYAAFAIPQACTVSDRGWAWATRKLGPEAYERYKDVRMAEEYFQREQIQYPPVRNAIEAAAGEDDLYFQSDGHFNRNGVRVVTDVLEEFILANYFADGRLPECVKGTIAERE